MGIDIVTAPLLAKSADLKRVDGESVMLGRQELFIPNSRSSRFTNTMSQYSFPLSYEDLHQQPPYFAEPFFGAIGIDNMRSLDATPHEGSDIVHDLNLPVKKDLKNRFSYIFDGGTLEHVFNIPCALDNVHKMLKPGGIFVSSTTGDGWFGHGFWQMSPEIVFSYWGTSRGYEILDVMEVPVRPRITPVTIPDTRATGKRAKKLTGPNTAYLWYVVRKPMKQIKYSIPQQSDYQTIWEKNEFGAG